MPAVELNIALHNKNGDIQVMDTLFENEHPNELNLTMFRKSSIRASLVRFRRIFESLLSSLSNNQTLLYFRKQYEGVHYEVLSLLVA